MCSPLEYTSVIYSHAKIKDPPLKAYQREFKFCKFFLKIFQYNPSIIKYRYKNHKTLNLYNHNGLHFVVVFKYVYKKISYGFTVEFAVFVMSIKRNP